MLIRLTWRYIRDHRWPVLAVAVLQVLTTIAALSLPTLNANIIDDGVLQGDIGYIWRTGGVMLALSAGQVVCAIASAYLGARIAMSVGRDARRDVFDAVQRFGTLEVSRFSPPSLITRSTNDIQQVQMVLLMTFTIMVQVPIMLVGGVVMAMRQDMQLSWILVAVIPLLALVMGIASTRLGPLFRQVQDRLDSVSKVLREHLSGVRIIRAFVMQREERERYATANAALKDVSLRVGLLMAFLFPAVQLIVMSAQVGVVYFGAHRVESGMEVGSLFAFLNYVMQSFM